MATQMKELEESGINLGYITKSFSYSDVLIGTLNVNIQAICLFLVKNSKMIGKKRKNIYSKNSENVPNGKRKKNNNSNKKFDANDFQSNLFKFNNYLKYESMNFFYNNNSKYSTNKYIPSFSF